MKILETRKREGYTVRRYVDEETDVRQTTVEVPIAVLRAFSMRRVLAQIEITHRGHQKRVAATALKREIMLRVKDGWKPAAVAHELGCTDTYVRFIKRGADKTRVRVPQVSSKRAKPLVSRAKLESVFGADA
jgi:hypothetical protein